MFTGTLRKSAVLFLLVLLVSLLAGCNEPIPNSDLQEAKQAIAVAEAAKAAQYDPDNLQAAKDSYSKALKMVVEDENAAARKLALEAKQKADLATENSRRKLAEATIKEAEELLVKADQQRASFLAAAQFREAQTKLDDAKRAFSEGKYVQAYTDAENSKEASGKAIDEANQKMAALNKAFSDADLALKRALASDVVKKYAPQELDKIQKDFQQGEQDKKKVEDPSTITAGSKEMRDNLAKDAYDNSLKAAQKAIDDVSEAFRLALQREQEEYRKMAKDRLDTAKRLLEEIERLKQQGLIKSQAIAPSPEPGTDSTTSSNTNPAAMSNQEKYDAALKALQRAEQTYQSQNYQTSIQNSEEAIRLAKLIKAMMQTAGITYIVKWTDCLWKIASFAAHYGDPSLWPRIWKANKHLIVDPDLIYPDQKFNIPPKE